MKFEIERMLNLHLSFYNFLVMGCIHISTDLKKMIKFVHAILLKI